MEFGGFFVAIINEKSHNVLRLKDSYLPMKRAGIGAKINTAVNVCKYYVEKYQDDSLSIEDRELNSLFDFPLNTKNRRNIRDINSEYALYNSIEISHAHTLADMNLIRDKRKIFDHFFKLKNFSGLSSLSNELIDDKTCGLQIRGTDKFNEVAPPKINNIFEKVEHVLSDGATSIFLATDDSYFRDTLIAEFGDTIKWNQSHRISTDGKPLHLRMRRKKINTQLLEDVFVLSKCPMFLYSFSNVSYLALTMGAGDFSYIDNINTPSNNLQ
jgi:hypothetical protein